MNRLYNLDYLRGLAAFGIMIYHYLSWTLGKFSSETFMGRVGIYGVSIFYVLSGLTLFYVYHNKMGPTKSDITDFIRKRFFRIFPLLWLATILSILLSATLPDPFDLALNLTGLFGFVKWDTYFATGIWSIGNELVFYVFFPFFIFFIKNSRTAFVILSAILFCIYLYFAFSVLGPDKTLSDQWRDYVNPLNQVFLFLGGFIIGVVFKKNNLNTPLILLIMFAGLGLFVLYPAQGNTINLVTGVNRLIFTLSCFLICISFYKLNVKLPKIINTPLTLLGEASYSVYLLHPLFYIIVGSVTHYFNLPETIRLIASVSFTLFFSYIVYQYFEKYFMKLGHKKQVASPA